jgi:hypothetical protein
MMAAALAGSRRLRALIGLTALFAAGVLLASRF